MIIWTGITGKSLIQIGDIVDNEKISHLNDTVDMSNGRYISDILCKNVYYGN